MKFSMLRHRVERAETLLEGRRQQVVENAGNLLGHWKRGWTPLRIVGSGLGLGYLIGQTHPTRAMDAAHWLKMASSVAGILTSLHASFAAWQASKAADNADDAADSAESAAGATHRAASTVHQSADGPDMTAKQAAEHAARTRAAGMATADDGGHRARAALKASSYALSLAEHRDAGPGTPQPPPPAEAATHVSER